MMMKKMIAITLASALIVTGFSPFASKASANDDITVSMDQSVSLTDEQMESIKNSPDFDWVEGVAEDGEMELTLDDAQFIDYLSLTGQDDILTQVKDEGGLELYAAGVTKIKKNSLGGYDVYLSKLVCQTLAVGGAAAIGVLVALIPGIGWTIAGAVLGSMSAHLGANIKNGKVFRFSKSWGLKSVWSQ
ncbi:hypothetical protein ACQKKK_08870 [Peribacillus sp. NPDC006672]|uniref:hypothetical protein n=1 Tax=Peribacillus sp. NPDC006672 TaxID=3390606 RepID=UPI003D02B497